MKFTDSVVIQASRPELWRFLLDPYALGPCVPGLKTVNVIAEGRAFGGVAEVSLGSSSFQVPIRVDWLEKRPEEGGRLQMLMQVRGHEIRAEGVLDLLKADDGTRLDWRVDASLPETLQQNALLLQIGRQMMTRFIKGFFECLKTTLSSV